MLAVPWFVMGLSGSSTSMGLMVAAEMLPYVLMLGFGGPVVDRIGPRRLSVATDALAACSMMAAPLCAWAGGALPLSLLAATLAATGFSRGLGDLARKLLLPLAAERGGTPVDRLYGLYEGSGRLAGLVGGPLAGVVIASISAPAALAFDALSYAASALLVVTLFPRDGAKTSVLPGGAATRYFEELREGLAFLRNERLLAAVVLLLVITNLLDQAYSSVLLPRWTKATLDSPLALGIVEAAFGAGAVAGNLGMAALAPRLPRRLPFAISFFVCGVPRFFTLAAVSSFAPIVVVSALSGLGAGGINPALGAIEYERIPPRLRSRVMGAINACAWIGIPFGGLVGGGLSDLIGLRFTLGLCGLAYLGAVLSPFVRPVWRQMERRGVATD